MTTKLVLDITISDDADAKSFLDALDELTCNHTVSDVDTDTATTKLNKVNMLLNNAIINEKTFQRSRLSKRDIEFLYNDLMEKDVIRAIDSTRNVITINPANVHGLRISQMLADNIIIAHKLLNADKWLELVELVNSYAGDVSNKKAMSITNSLSMDNVFVTDSNAHSRHYCKQDELGYYITAAGGIIPDIPGRYYGDELGPILFHVNLSTYTIWYNKLAVTGNANQQYGIVYSQSFLPYHGMHFNDPSMRQYPGQWRNPNYALDPRVMQYQQNRMNQAFPNDHMLNQMDMQPAGPGSWFGYVPQCQQPPAHYKPKPFTPHGNYPQPNPNNPDPGYHQMPKHPVTESRDDVVQRTTVDSGYGVTEERTVPAKKPRTPRTPKA